MMLWVCVVFSESELLLFFKILTATQCNHPSFYSPFTPPETSREQSKWGKNICDSLRWLSLIIAPFPTSCENVWLWLSDVYRSWIHQMSYCECVIVHESCICMCCCNRTSRLWRFWFRYRWWSSSPSQSLPSATESLAAEPHPSAPEHEVTWS